MMDVLVLLESQLSDADRALVAEWQRDAFGEQAWTKRYTWAGPELRLFLRDNSTPLSHLKIVTRRASVGGREVLLGGIGSVMTPTPLRGRGHASVLLDRAAEWMFDELDVELGMLFCLERLVPFYASKGWIAVRSPVWIDQPGGRMLWPERAMVLPPDGNPWTDAEIEVRGLPW